MPVPVSTSTVPFQASVTPPTTSAAPEPPPRDCPPGTADDLRLVDTSPESASIEISRAVYDCAHEAGLAPADDLAAIAALASHEIDGPLLLAEADLSDALLEELERLAPERVMAAGIDELLALEALSDFEVEHVDASQANTGTQVDPEQQDANEQGDNAAPADTAPANGEQTNTADDADTADPTNGTGELSDANPANDADEADTADPTNGTGEMHDTEETTPAVPVDGDGRPLHDRVWIVDAMDAAALAAVAGRVGVGVVAATDDLRALPQAAREAIAAASEVEVLADLGDDAAWQLDVVRRGEELPGGGLLLFERGDEHPQRRLVAAYGHPSTGALGVLGEQGPEKAVKRLESIAEGYGADGSEVLLTFEIIATVASASAGADGDYSSSTAHEALRPWIEAATANGAYVVLDLQPGRSDFLSQAKRYEEFLRLPNVGLALDPEWRLTPDQVHLRQVGTVDAAEINRVVDWLAGIVREEALPQKLLIVHQFRFSMITNREQIKTPPELAVMIHMDGQGSLGAKYNTWNALTGLPDADRYYWGWKNFYDEDSPMATPEQVLELSPEILFVSFQ